MGIRKCHLNQSQQEMGQHPTRNASCLEKVTKKIQLSYGKKSRNREKKTFSLLPTHVGILSRNCVISH